MDGYVWRIAHNRYAKTVEARKRDATFLCGDEYLFNLPSAPAEEDKTEEYQAIFRMQSLIQNKLPGVELINPRPAAYFDAFYPLINKRAVPRLLCVNRKSIRFV